MTVVTVISMSETEFDGELDVTAMPTERLEAAASELAAHLAAATCRFLVMIGELDQRQAWAGWGMASCAHWLSWHCAIGSGAAREHVRVARAMADLPLLRAAFAEGRLSYSKMRAVTRIATPAIETRSAQPRARKHGKPGRALGPRLPPGKLPRANGS